MKNPIIIFVVVVAFVILGIGAYTLSQKSSQFGSMMKKDDNTMEDNKMMDDKMNDSRYVQYDKSAFDNASRNRRILFFYASWCPTCKPADVDLKANSKKMPDDLTVIRVNYNDPETDQEEKDLAIAKIEDGNKQLRNELNSREETINKLKRDQNELNSKINSFELCMQNYRDVISDFRMSDFINK
jgi:thiol-disulfide isomerase/thioredoxin